MYILISIYILGMLGFVLHLFFDKKKLTRFRVVELFLLYQLVFSVGIASFLSFIGFIFFPDLVADALGWNMSPFQHELANASLGFGVLGIMSIWVRAHFWMAVVIGRAIWLLGDAIGHIYHIYAYQNYTEGNAGVPLYSDIVVPLLTLFTLYLYFRLGKIPFCYKKVSSRDV